MKLFNTLTRKIEEFRPIKEGQVGIYSCGPTVYWNQHLGHMYAYVHWDCLVRALRFEKVAVKWVMNITDVGHMTSDEDAGEDKMEKGAKREGLSVWQIADKYISQFIDSMEALNVQQPDVLCRATQHIPEQIELIKKIEANGFAYKTATGLVFDTAKFPDYARFAKLNLKKQEAGARVAVDPGKKQPWDFLLWVTNQPEHVMKWDSPWGVGFPGWHIECTAMSVKYLGETFDIHTGGKEHIPVHHTDEIAQAYGAFGHQTANFWLHNEWLVINGEKMSKSLGNNVTVQDLIAKGFDPLAHRYLILNSHYRTGLNFTWQSLEGAQTALNRLRERAEHLKATNRSSTPADEVEFLAAVNDDLNLPKALAVAWKTNSYESLLKMDQVLGLKLDAIKETPVEIKELLAKREKLRAQGKYDQADEIRKQIEEKGFTIKDNRVGK
ncbi:MAG: cysteine--tRNA ligase [Patescibacteria group bacterium]|nr:cysteine--tRNA ligase [Patescibacteria group bacterium]MCL5432168.1 cysteine--tRNA ligase [Patescibacteria group bacterium]